MRNEEIGVILTATNWNDLFADFLGDIEQVPPMYSAKKIDGQKLYDLARRGKTVKREAVRVTISKLEIMDMNEFRTPHSALRICVACSAGTYIRTLAEDIGREVGTGAHLAELRRTRAGGFDLSRSITIDDLEKLDDPITALIGMDEAVGHLSSITLTADRVKKTKNGLSTRLAETQFTDRQPVKLLDENDNLIGVGFFDETENSIRPKVVLV